jgi:hypothetical protein
MEKISYIEYSYEPEGERKNIWKQKINHTLFSSSKGYKISYYDNNGDINKIMANFAKGSRAEETIRQYLNKVNPDRTFNYADPEAAGYFIVGKKPDNKHDLESSFGEKVEVKGYNIYNGQYVYFTTRLSTPERFWKEVIHNADALIVYDEKTKLGGILRKEDFLTSYEILPNNWFTTATTWKLKLTEVKEIKNHDKNLLQNVTSRVF